jgi:hypothetical protein
VRCHSPCELGTRTGTVLKFLKFCTTFLNHLVVMPTWSAADRPSHLRPRCAPVLLAAALLACAGASQPAPPHNLHGNWVAIWTADEQAYFYYNTDTGHSVWELPGVPATQAAGAPRIPPPPPPPPLSAHTPPPTETYSGETTAKLREAGCQPSMMSPRLLPQCCHARINVGQIRGRFRLFRRAWASPILPLSHSVTGILLLVGVDVQAFNGHFGKAFASVGF